MPTEDGTLDNDYEDNGAIPADEDTYSATEDILSAYVMGQANIGKWEFIGGVRIEQTDVSVRNLELTEDEDAGTETLMPIRTNTDYTEVLPRLQINYRASDDLVFRGAAFASLARPEFQFIAGTTEIAIEDGTADVFLGNPSLKSAYAWNFDFGVEYYFGGIGTDRQTRKARIVFELRRVTVPLRSVIVEDKIIDSLVENYGNRNRRWYR